VLLLSERGRLLLSACEESHRRQMENALSRFDTVPLKQLNELLELLIDGLSQSQAAIDSRTVAADRSSAKESSRLSA
jgi:hypothetical protein